ncbi:GNAT family N-acetyltransferase [Rubidibacter lacunae]|uniref:GNAT family N-acetyltransferase n=1 Tax=Rubidibacter lacunae TaxID=582514 RepID=UPI0018DDBEF1
MQLLASVADDVFDDAIDSRRAKKFPSDPGHHLVVALVDSQIIGFASTVHYLHPDKPSPELWVNELGGAPPFRKQGVATLCSKCSLKSQPGSAAMLFGYLQNATRQRQ